MRRVVILTAVITGAINVSALAADTPMQPGLWAMQISGTTKVSSPPISTPMQRSMQLCVKANQKPESVFLPAGSVHCSSSHKTLSDGKTQWTFHCRTPSTMVTQVGWFRTGAHHLNSHWVITDEINGAAHYTTVTAMQMQGKHLSDHCGAVK